MSLIASISGIRGTIGGRYEESFNPINITEFVVAFATFIQKTTPIKSNKIVVGRDGRISGEIVEGIVVSTLRSMGFDVVVLGYSSTPTTEIAVDLEHADGGIIITASHNPRNWNALKLLNHRGEFLNAVEGKQVLDLAQERNVEFASVDSLGNLVNRDYTERHIMDIVALPEVDVQAISAADFTVVIDCVNSVGAKIIPVLMNALGVKKVYLMNVEMNGQFAHNPEPLPENLVILQEQVKKVKAHVGFAVDPDVDRLAIISEDGTAFGEENTLVSIADYILSSNPGGNTVSNLSSSRALRDLTQSYGGVYHSSAVGEVNVVEKMKEVGAVIGGEGNGGVIFPKLHYGRDAVLGIALYLTMMAKKFLTPTQILSTLPSYVMCKKKVELPQEFDFDLLKGGLKKRYSGNAKFTEVDGIKMDFDTEWVHIRKSNTEPILRIYAEAKSMIEAESLVEEVIAIINTK